MLLYIGHKRSKQSTQIYLLLHVLTRILLQIDKLLDESSILLEHIVAGTGMILNRLVIVEPHFTFAFEQTQFIFYLSSFGWHDNVPSVAELLGLTFAVFKLVDRVGTHIMLPWTFIIDAHVHAFSIFEII